MAPRPRGSGVGAHPPTLTIAATVSPNRNRKRSSLRRYATNLKQSRISPSRGHIGIFCASANVLITFCF